jgi:hypothetical protein
LLQTLSTETLHMNAWHYWRIAPPATFIGLPLPPTQ